MPSNREEPVSLRPLITVADVSSIVGLSEYTVRQAIRDGELHASKLRGRFRIHPDDVRTWIEASPAAAPRTQPRPGLTAAPAPHLPEATPENIQALIARTRKAA